MMGTNFLLICCKRGWFSFQCWVKAIWIFSFLCLPEMKKCQLTIMFDPRNLLQKLIFTAPKLVFWCSKAAPKLPFYCSKRLKPASTPVFMVVGIGVDARILCGCIISLGSNWYLSEWLAVGAVIVQTAPWPAGKLRPIAAQACWHSIGALIQRSGRSLCLKAQLFGIEVSRNSNALLSCHCNPPALLYFWWRNSSL